MSGRTGWSEERRAIQAGMGRGARPRARWRSSRWRSGAHFGLARRGHPIERFADVCGQRLVGGRTHGQVDEGGLAQLLARGREPGPEQLGRRQRGARAARLQRGSEHSLESHRPRARAADQGLNLGRVDHGLSRDRRRRGGPRSGGRADASRTAAAPRTRSKAVAKLLAVVASRAEATSLFASSDAEPRMTAA